MNSTDVGANIQPGLATPDALGYCAVMCTDASPYMEGTLERQQIHRQTHTHKTTTVTLAHARRGLCARVNYVTEENH